MKRIIFYSSLLCIAALPACKKDLENRFYNPDQLTSGVADIVPGVFTQTISNNKLFIQDYGEWFYLLNGGTSITGYAQVNGYRGETAQIQLMEKRVEYDVMYMENWSFLLDLKIIYMTVRNMLKGEKNAY